MLYLKMEKGPAVTIIPAIFAVAATCSALVAV